MASRLIAHQIIKSANSIEATEVLRDVLIPTDTPIAESLVEQLRSAIRRRNPLSGRFRAPDIEAPALQRALLRYHESASDESFVELSKGLTRYLRSEMQDKPFATGGYIVFAEHDHAGETLLLIVLLSTHAQPWFDHDLNLQSAHTLDFDQLRHGARFRYSDVQPNNDGVVHYVSRSSDGVANYFMSFLGCEPLTDSTAQGRYLLSTLRTMADRLQLDRDNLLQAAHSYWRECRKEGRSMTLTGLSNRLMPDSPERALEILGDPSTKLAGEFDPPAPSVMRDFLKFEFSEAGLKLAFERDQWLDNVTCRERTVTIRNAPVSLIQQLREEKGHNA